MNKNIYSFYNYKSDNQKPIFKEIFVITLWFVLFLPILVRIIFFPLRSLILKFFFLIIDYFLYPSFPEIELYILSRRLEPIINLTFIQVLIVYSVLLTILFFEWKAHIKRKKENGAKEIEETV